MGIDTAPVQLGNQRFDGAPNWILSNPRELQGGAQPDPSAGCALPAFGAPETRRRGPWSPRRSRTV